MRDRRERFAVREVDGGIIVEWEDRNGPHELRIDHVPATEPRWIGAAADLEAEVDRRDEGDLVEVLVRFANERGETLALFHDNGRIEYLTDRR